MKERPDIIVMDLLLKHKNGFEILRNLKNSIWTKNIPVFIFSELDTDLCREEAYRIGAAGYMSKPNHFSSLLSGIRAEKSSEKQICSQNSIAVL
jgi:DNA-binding response OmpR family regulator